MCIQQMQKEAVNDCYESCEIILAKNEILGNLIFKTAISKSLDNQGL